MVEPRNRRPSRANAVATAHTLKSLGIRALALCLLVTACGGDDEPTCGTIDEPLLLEVVDLVPADGSSVTNAEIVHGLTVRGLDALIDEFAFVKSSLHTAGDPVPSTFSITPTAVDENAVRYDFAPFRWDEAPSHAEIVTGSVYTSGKCVYALPTPLFRYDVTEP